MNQQTYETSSEGTHLATAVQDIERARKSYSLTPEALAILQSMTAKAGSPHEADRVARIIHQVTEEAGTAGTPRWHLH